MNTVEVNFSNAEGIELTGLLQLPVDQQPHNYAIFAHCFTCNKSFCAIRHISNALTKQGFAVLRFDFTGLGESEGSFANSDFSGNVDDIIAAADFLRSTYKAPSLLVGHSLGGTACLMAASSISEIRAVATLGSPADPEHVRHLIKNGLNKIENEGSAEVQIGGRSFLIRKQFLIDLENQPLTESLGDLNCALLFLHSPQDQIVSIDNAEKLYLASRHPKSFISLDKADHLLDNEKDSFYSGSVIAQWAKRYVELPETRTLESDHQVVARLDKVSGFTTTLQVGNHGLTADEPKSYGGQDFGPSPYELVSAGLAACTAMTLHMYAKHKKWDLQDVEVHTSYSKTHAEDCKKCDENTAKIDTFSRAIKVFGDLDEAQKQRLLEIANRCPVHKTLHSETQIPTRLLS